MTITVSHTPRFKFHFLKMGQRDGNFETKDEIISVESKSVVTPIPYQSNKSNDNCCGVKCVWTDNADNNCECNCEGCRQCCGVCAKSMPPFSWPCCFYNLAAIACHIIIITGSIYWITVTEPRLEDCRAFTAFERHDCLNDMNSAVVGYAFSYSAMIYSVSCIICIFTWLFNEQCRQPHAPYECTDCRPNVALGYRIGQIVGCVMVFVGIFLFVYCVEFSEDCRNDDDVCESYDKNHLGGYMAGIVFGLNFLIFGLIVALVGFSKQ